MEWRLVSLINLKNFFNRYTITFDFKKEGVNELIMMACPHHMEVL